MKLLVFGAQTAAGAAAARYFNLKYEVHAPMLSAASLCDRETVFCETEAYAPDAVLFFPPRYTERLCADTDAAFRENSYSAGLCALAAASVGAVFMLFSSYRVYGEGKMPHTEDETPSPSGTLGKTLFEAEKLAAVCGKHFVLRCGEVFDEKGGILESFESLLDEKGFVKVSDEKKGSFVSAPELAVIADRLIDRAEYGIYNAAGVGAASWYELACEIFRLYDAGDRVVAASSSEFSSSSLSPDNFALSLEKLRSETGSVPPDWHDMLKHVIKEKQMLKQAAQAAEREDV